MTLVAQAAYRRSRRDSARRRRLGIGDVARHMRDAFVEHNLLTYGAAVAFQMIVALLPLAFLSLALLGAFGLGHLWADSIAPGLRGHVTPQVYRRSSPPARRSFPRARPRRSPSPACSRRGT